MTSPIGDAVVVAERAALARPWVKPLLYVGAFLIVAVIVGVLVYRIFFQAQDLARARGNNIEAGEQGRAEGKIVGATIDAMKDGRQEQQRVNVVVTDARSKVDEAWHGETVGDDVDAAGAAALCSLHDSLCRLPPAEAVQPLHGPVPRADEPRAAAGE